MATVSLRDLVKVYGRQPAVRGVDLDIADREFVVFVGPSGCGKSTTLRMIAGLETISHGELLSTAASPTMFRHARAAWRWCSRPTHSTHT